MKATNLHNSKYTDGQILWSIVSSCFILCAKEIIARWDYYSKFILDISFISIPTQNDVKMKSWKFSALEKT